MMLKEILEKTAIQTNLQAKDKEGAVSELVSLLSQAYNLKDEKKIVESVSNREKLGSTGMGHGVAIPHCKIEGLDAIHLGIGITKEGIDFKALDGEPVYIFFILVAPADEAGSHLKALARISKLLRDEYFCRSLRNAESTDMIYNIVITDDEKF